ncbi:MAG: rRNA maturation RNase YbeY [Tissierellia bacterium]|nr:rRNA maturation RNase YbeY [Tissierellia bacterium]
MTGTKQIRHPRFHLTINLGPYHISKRELRLLLSVIERTLEIDGYFYPTTISMSFVEPSVIRRLNRDFRGKDKVTDVLSFPIDEEGGILGDVVLCPKRAHAQAKLYGNSFERELCYLTCHSILHLLGHDHMFPLEKRLMRKQEKRVMRDMMLE